MKNLLFALGFVLFASTSSAQTNVGNLVQFMKDNGLCVLLIQSGATDLGLQMQFEVDPEFYSKTNRALYSKNLINFFVTETNRLGYSSLSKDEKQYVDQKWASENNQVKTDWGYKATSEGISSWDEPFRKCVKDLKLAN